MTKTLSYRIAEFIYNLDLSDIPSDVQEKAKLLLLDTLGIMMATYDFIDVKRVINVAKLISGDGRSTVIGHNYKTSPMSAAFANATMAHSVDYDDTHLGSVIHQSCIVIPTALAVGEECGSSGEEILEAIIGAYEVNARLGMVAPAKFHLRGFHPTSVVGVFGAALTASKLMGLSIEEMANALGLAGSMAAGVIQCIVEGVWVKPIHAGLGSFAGILAAYLAKEGCKGPREIFEGKSGFFNTYMHGEELDFDAATRGLGETWETLNISIKPYPTCHATHSSIDAAREIREKYRLSPEDIKEFTCYVPKLTIDLVVEPWEEKINPSDPYGAKFSLPYTVIVALKNGWVGLWDFTEEAIKNPDILKHTPKVKGIWEKSYDRYGRTVLPAKAVVNTVDGKTYQVEVINHKGTPGNPMTKEEVITKFMDNTKFSKYKDIGKELTDKVLNLEKYNVKDIAALLEK